MAYRDELEAARARIAELETKVAELESAKAPEPSPPPPPRRTRSKGDGTRKAAVGVPLTVLGLVGVIAFGSPTCARGCATVSGEGDEAIAALRACPAARDVLGDDIGWSAVGCGNCKSRSGGDPTTTGCQSSSYYSIPVSGTKSRGTYSFGSSTRGGTRRRSSGFVTTSTHTITVEPDGRCTAHPL